MGEVGDKAVGVSHAQYPAVGVMRRDGGDWRSVVGMIQQLLLILRRIDMFQK